VQYQWTLLEGVNDSEAELDGIVRLLRGKYAVMNMIPYNTIDGLDFKRPSWEAAAAIARSLHRRGVLTKLRHSAGQDVEGGCGQLRARRLVIIDGPDHAGSKTRHLSGEQSDTEVTAAGRSASYTGPLHQMHRRQP
jgi:hypothetical protein